MKKQTKKTLKAYPIGTIIEYCNPFDIITKGMKNKLYGLVIENNNSCLRVLMSGTIRTFNKNHLSCIKRLQGRGRRKNNKNSCNKRFFVI